MQPFEQLIDGGGVATGQHFDVAVRQIDGVSGDTQGLGDAAGAGAKEDTLHPAFDNETTGGSHQRRSGPVFLVCCALAQRTVCYFFRGKRVAARLRVIAAADRLLGAVEQFDRRLQIRGRMLSGARLPGSANGLTRVGHFLHRRRCLTRGNSKQRREQRSAQ